MDAIGCTKNTDERTEGTDGARREVKDGEDTEEDNEGLLPFFRPRVPEPGSFFPAVAIRASMSTGGGFPSVSRKGRHETIGPANKMFDIPSYQS